MDFNDSVSQVQLKFLKPQVMALQQKLKALAEFAQDTEIDPTRDDGTMDLGTFVALFHATQQIGGDLPGIVGDAFDILTKIEKEIDELPWWSDVVLKIFFSPWTIDECTDAILAILSACHVDVTFIRSGLDKAKVAVANAAPALTTAIEAYLIINVRSLSGDLHGNDCVDASSIGGNSCTPYIETRSDKCDDYARTESDGRTTSIVKVKLPRQVRIQHEGRNVCVTESDLCNRPDTAYAYGRCVSTKGRILESATNTRLHNFSVDKLHLLDKLAWETKRNKCKYVWVPKDKHGINYNASEKWCVKDGELPFVSSPPLASGYRKGAFFNEKNGTLEIKEYYLKNIGALIIEAAEDLYEVVTEYGCMIVNNPFVVGGVAGALSIVASPATGALVVAGAQTASTACAVVKVAEAMYLILKLISTDHRQPTWTPSRVNRIERMQDKFAKIQLPPPVRKPKVSSKMLEAFKVPNYVPGTYAVLFENKYYIMSPTAALPRRLNVATGIVTSALAAKAGTTTTPTYPTTTPTYPTTQAPKPKRLSIKASGLSGMTPEDIKSAQSFTPSDHTLIDVLASAPASMEVRTLQSRTPASKKWIIFVGVGALALGTVGFVGYRRYKRRRR